MSNLILIVCNGNIHRSVIAEQCINSTLRQNRLDEKYLVVSRGLQGTGGTKSPEHKNLYEYPLEWSLTKPILNEIGITIPCDKVATPINVQIVDEAVLILAMDRGVLLTRANSLVNQFPSSGFKMRLFAELEGGADYITDLYGQKDSAVVRREILRIDTILKTRTKQLIALAEILTIQKERKTS